MKCKTVLLLGLGLLLACHKGSSQPSHDHAAHGDHGHHAEHGNHHAQDHGHGHGAAKVEAFTLWSEHYELFGELTRQEHHHSQVLLHLTQLREFTPLQGQSVELEWEVGNSALQRVALKERQPGVFIGELPIKVQDNPRIKVLVGGAAIRWSGVESELIDIAQTQEESHDHDHEHNAEGVPPEDHPGPHTGDHSDGEIELLKEQQWSIPFGTAEVQQGSLEPTKEVLGHVEIPPSSTAQISAPMAGRILQPKGGFPNPGQTVQAGQILARIAPTVQSADQFARLRLAVANARTALEGSRSELARQKRLAAQRATSQRSLEQAQHNFSKAQETLRAAEASQRIYGRGSQNSVAVPSPISGVLTDIDVRIGELAAMGQVMFRVSNTQETWLRVHIPVQWLSELQRRGPISVFDDAKREWRRYSTSSQEARATEASLLNVAVKADLNTQIVDVLYGIHSTDLRWLVGAAKRVLVPVGEPRSGWVLPKSAVIHERGIDKVFVQVDGEHFTPRNIRIEMEQGDQVLVSAALRKGQRVVVKGAAVVGLAAKSDTAIGHGHLH